MFARLILLLSIITGLAAAQTLPLDSIDVEGTTQITKEAVIRFSGLQIGEPTNKDKIEAACQTLQATQLFDQISYNYKPGAKHGYAVTFTLSDLGRIMNAAIDLPGAKQTEYWDWMKTISPAFDHKVAGPAQDFLAKQIEQHAGAALNGQHVVARLETDLVTRTNLVSFQPENLPLISSIRFEGQSEFTASELTALLKNPMAVGYTDRTFNRYVDLNLRPVYENHGMYRVRFAPVICHPQTQSSVSVTLPIEEGGKYTLGKVELVGDNMPRDAMLKAAKLPAGQIANWMIIQNGIYEMEKQLKRVGYFEAVAEPQRNLDDSAHTLNLNIPFRTGPVYHFADTIYKGLNPELEAKAKSVWKREPGDTWDVMYVNEFLGEFKKDKAVRNLKVSLEERASKNAHSVAEVLTFTAP